MISSHQLLTVLLSLSNKICDKSLLNIINIYRFGKQIIMYKKERPKLSVTALLYGTQSPNTWIQQHSGMLSS